MGEKEGGAKEDNWERAPEAKRAERATCIANNESGVHHLRLQPSEPNFPNRNPMVKEVIY